MVVKDDRKQHLDAIIEAAIRVFAKRGYRGASLKEVASEAGVSKPTLYNYFESKASLYLDMLRRLEKRMQDAIQEAVDPKKTAREKVLAALQVQFDFARKNGELIKAAHTAMFLPDGIKEQMNLLPLLQTRFGVMERIVREGIEGGEFEGDAMDTAMVLSSLASLGLAQALLPSFPILQPGLEERLGEVVFSGIEKDDGGASPEGSSSHEETK